MQKVHLTYVVGWSGSPCPSLCLSNSLSDDTAVALLILAIESVEDKQKMLLQKELHMYI